VAEKTVNLRRVLSDMLLSACALSVLLALLVGFDSRVREEVTRRMDSAQASVELAAAQSHARRLTAVVVEVAKEQSQQHAPLMIFLVVATVLTLFMVRI
jgi:hypothetical protein